MELENTCQVVHRMGVLAACSLQLATATYWIQNICVHFENMTSKQSLVTHYLPRRLNSRLSRFTPPTPPHHDPLAPSPRAELCNLARDQPPQHLHLPLIRLHLQRLQTRPIPPPLIHAVHDREIRQHLSLRHRTQRPDLAVLKRPKPVSAMAPSVRV